MSMISAATAAPPYRDPKRPAWLLSALVPAFIGSGALLVLWTGDARMAWLPVVFLYLVVPGLDLLLGEDRSNPPESAVPALQADPYYRRVTYATVPVLWLSFIANVGFLATHALPLHAQLALVLSAGLAGGFGINLGHELGHKNTKLERWLAKIILAPTGYGHFFIEHNRATTAMWPRQPTRPARAWARRSTASCGARCPAPGIAPGRSKSIAWAAAASRCCRCTTRCCSRS
jgi:hypothetical protein